MDLRYAAERFSLDGKKAVVTGASGGIGRAIAEAMARLGAEVAGLGRNPQKLRDTEGAIRAFGGKCETWAFDVADPLASDAFFRDYEAKHGAPDVFVCNAGTTVLKNFTETEDEEMEHLLKTDFKGAVYGMRWAGNVMKERGGQIIVITSVNAFYPLPSQAVYTGIKCALEGMVRCMASELAPYNIRVNTCAPGAVNTDLAHPHSPTVRIAPGIPLGHAAQPEEIGEAVALMATEAFRYMTGSTVLIDGGLMLRKP